MYDCLIYNQCEVRLNTIANYRPCVCDVLRTENTGFNLSFVMIKLKIM